MEKRETTMKHDEKWREKTIKNYENKETPMNNYEK